MAKSKWDDVKEKLILIEAWARDGLTDEQIAHNLGISKDTFYTYKKEHTDFSDSLKRGKEVVDVEVENALYKKATGFIMKIKKAFKVKHVKYNEGKRVSEDEEVILAEEEVYISPDTTAQIFWLKNRKPMDWRDKHEFEANVTSQVVIMGEDKLED
jgi:DNA-binding XRE family transcriptional regulator